VFLAIVAAVAVTAAAPHNTLAALERSLDNAIKDDAPIQLRVSDNFEDAPGAVIFTSRKDGIRRLVALAHAGKNETSLFYLPRWGAWLTEAVVRTVDITSSDTRYCEAAMQSEPVIELWHFHNSIGVPDIGGELTVQQIKRMWAMPSALDLEELYAWAEMKPKAAFRGFVASTLGVVEYWSDDYDTDSNPFFLEKSLVSEAMLIKLKARDAAPDSLGIVLARHRGIFWYRFTPVP
jgi:hypothetical protein